MRRHNGSRNTTSSSKCRPGPQTPQISIWSSHLWDMLEQVQSTEVPRWIGLWALNHQGTDTGLSGGVLCCLAPGRWWWILWGALPLRNAVDMRGCTWFAAMFRWVVHVKDHSHECQDPAEHCTLKRWSITCQLFWLMGVFHHTIQCKIHNSNSLLIYIVKNS